MNQYNNTATEEREIDLLELGKQVWGRRKFVLKVCGIALIVALIIVFSLPDEYTTTVLLAPETVSGNSGSMGQLATMITGVRASYQSNMQDLTPEVYPNILGSTPFLIGLFNVPVKDSKLQLDTTLYVYLAEHQKKAWWSYIVNVPFKLIGMLSPKQPPLTMREGGAGKTSGVIVISKKQASILKDLSARLVLSVSQKTGGITLTSTMQSPEVSALIADTVISYLQDYIIGYRTKKARQDLNFAESAYQEAQVNYYEAQQAYASYVDQNVGIILAQYRTTQERLLNEMNITSGVYNQTALQLQLAKVKVQDVKPVYTVVQPAVMPLKPSSPKILLILLGCLFLAFTGACGWILMKAAFGEGRE